MRPTFHSIRIRFGVTFNEFRAATKKTLITLEDLKLFLCDCYEDLTPKLACPSCDTIDGVLDVVKEKCTLIDIYILVAIAERFGIKKAETHIKSYNVAIDEFCQTVTTRLCLKETFEISKSSPLKCETAKFILDWDPDQTSLADIKDLLSITFGRLNRRVKVIIINEGSSIIVTCTFPLNLNGSLITKALETLEMVKEKGLIRLTIGCCTIYDKCRDDVRNGQE